jgi:hypothetical protein
VTEYCPVCHDRRLDPAAIDRHNLRCAETGERAYPERTRPEYRRPLTREATRDRHP